MSLLLSTDRNPLQLTSCQIDCFSQAYVTVPTIGPPIRDVSRCGHLPRSHPPLRFCSSLRSSSYSTNTLVLESFQPYSPCRDASACRWFDFEYCRSHTVRWRPSIHLRMKIGSEAMSRLIFVEGFELRGTSGFKGKRGNSI